MRLNWTSEWRVMTIWISRELTLFNFERLDTLCAWIGLPWEKLWPLEFLESFCCSISCVSIYYAPESNLRVKIYDHLKFSRASVVQFRASRYIIFLNRTCKCQDMTIWISREFLLVNFECPDIWCAWIRLPREKLWSFQFLDSFHFSIESISINYAPESDICVKSYDNLNFSRASVVQFQASRYIMSLNRISVWKVMTIWISREHSLFHFERLDI